MWWVISPPAKFVYIPLILLKKVCLCTILVRMVDHMNAWLRPKRDQQFSHSLSEERTLPFLIEVKFAQHTDK
ncbi:hypothetical protein AIF85_15025 [Salmonella enterica subsp. enterica]|nr:hypothetical protein [Salmonella enterica subsp. enterica]EAR6148527.1 hypothetical protein [Salmonella enterica]EBI7912605.1 hypothetical protein [Salmonella enterica]EGX4944337.1 hypothetical protein [Salmonella enterica]MIC95454.1 hypothetical protein [Salmonella enterica]